VQQDSNTKYRKRDEGDLGDFGSTSITNSFSGGETDHLFISDKGKQFYDLDLLSGLAHPGDGRTVCLLDYDRDGWSDHVVSSANVPTLQLYRNRIGEELYPDAPGARVVALRYVGGNDQATPSSEWSARNGYGAIARLDVAGETLLREHRCGDGRSAQHSATMLVGIGDAPVVDRVRVNWPGGRKQVSGEVPVGSLVTVYENPADSPTGEAFVIEPYLRSVLSDGDALGTAAGERMEFDLPGSDGLARLNVVTAMSTHCATCKAKQPQVATLREAFGDEVGLFGVGTDLAEDSDVLAAYTAKHAPAYDVLPDLPVAQRQALKEHVIESVGDDLTPVSVVLGPGGEVLATVPGIPSVSDVRRLLERVR
jgi:hypothetical protein